MLSALMPHTLEREAATFLVTARVHLEKSQISEFSPAVAKNG
jgi:hypothetical protein